MKRSTLQLICWLCLFAVNNAISGRAGAPVVSHMADYGLSYDSIAAAGTGKVEPEDFAAAMEGELAGIPVLGRKINVGRIGSASPRSVPKVQTEADETGLRMGIPPATVVMDDLPPLREWTPDERVEAVTWRDKGVRVDRESLPVSYLSRPFRNVWIVLYALCLIVGCTSMAHWQPGLPYTLVMASAAMDACIVFHVGHTLLELNDVAVALLMSAKAISDIFLAMKPMSFLGFNAGSVANEPIGWFFGGIGACLVMANMIYHILSAPMMTSYGMISLVTNDRVIANVLYLLFVGTIGFAIHRMLEKSRLESSVLQMMMISFIISVLLTCSLSFFWNLNIANSYAELSGIELSIMFQPTSIFTKSSRSWYAFLVGVVVSTFYMGIGVLKGRSTSTTDSNPAYTAIRGGSPVPAQTGVVPEPSRSAN